MSNKFGVWDRIIDELGEEDGFEASIKLMKAMQELRLRGDTFVPAEELGAEYVLDHLLRLDCDKMSYSFNNDGLSAMVECYGPMEVARSTSLIYTAKRLFSCVDEFVSSDLGFKGLVEMESFAREFSNGVESKYGAGWRREYERVVRGALERCDNYIKEGAAAITNNPGDHELGHIVARGMTMAVMDAVIMLASHERSERASRDTDVLVMLDMTMRVTDICKVYVGILDKAMRYVSHIVGALIGLIKIETSHDGWIYVGGSLLDTIFEMWSSTIRHYASVVEEYERGGLREFYDDVEIEEMKLLINNTKNNKEVERWMTL